MDNTNNNQEENSLSQINNSNLSEAVLLHSKVENLKSVIVDIHEKQNVSELGDNFPDYVIKILEGEEKGKEIVTYSGGIKYKIGDEVFLQKTTETDNSIYYVIGDAIRYDSLIISFSIFLAVVIFVFGKVGIRSLISLLMSIGVIFFILLPMTLKGFNPVLVSSGISILLLSLVMFITHGKNRVTYSALIGCYMAIFITIIMSYYFIIHAKISGFVDETSTYLYYSTNGQINFSLLVIASMIIGVIGVVDDAAITQASAVAELKKINGKLSRFEYYKRAMKIGQSHGGAMVNTLVLAYIGSALPLALLFYTSDISPVVMINKEIIATEIFRILIGSVGLLLAIPFTTFVATYLVHSEDYNSHAGHNH